MNEVSQERREALLMDLVPNPRLSQSELKGLVKVCKKINRNLLQKDETFAQKVWSILDKTIIEF